MPFNSESAKEAGRRGGQSRSASKKKAALKNAKRGGRRSTRTLAEHLLERRLTPNQLRSIDQDNRRWLMIGESMKLLEYFEVSGLTEKDWKRKTRLPKEIRYLVERFRLAARYHLPRPAVQKDYTIVYRQPSPQRVEAWERRFPSGDPPCPPIPTRKYFKQIENFDQIVEDFKKNPNMTVEELKQLCGSDVDAKRFLEWLPVYVEEVTKTGIIGVLEEELYSVNQIAEAAGVTRKYVLEISKKYFSKDKHEANWMRPDMVD